jgi:hypothetical protein
MISTGDLVRLPLPAVPGFSARYKAAYKREMNAECVLHYNPMKVLAKTIQICQSLDPQVIRRNMPKALPTLGDTVPNELFAMNDKGFMYCGLITQQVKGGKFTKVNYLFTFPETAAEFAKYKKMSKTTDPGQIQWVPIKVN